MKIALIGMGCGSAGAALVPIGRPPETGEPIEEILSLFPSVPLS